MNEEIKSILNSGNACYDYHSVQSLLSSFLLSKNVKDKIYKTIILPVVLYGYETCSLTLRELHRLRVFENRVLRRTYGPKRDEVTEKWRKFHNEELQILYSSPNIIRQYKPKRMRWAGHVACMREKRKVHKVLAEKTEGKIGWRSVEWIQLSQDRDRWGF
jgi:hypothetical protein